MHFAGAQDRQDGAVSEDRVLFLPGDRSHPWA
jgi:hypothetical protein